MDIKVTTNQATATITMNGRFDFGAHRVFRDSYEALLQEPGIRNIEVNLAGVEYMDSSALGMLLLLHERAEASGKEIALCKPNPTVSQILDIANFRKLFTIR